MKSVYIIPQISYSVHIKNKIIVVFNPEDTEDDFKGSRIQLAMWVGAMFYI